MDNVEDLYDYADRAGITVDYFMMSFAESLSEPVGNGAIAIDPFRITSSADEKVKLAHEIGHCEIGAFYNPYSPFDVVARHENRADRWAIKKLVPKDELDAAVAGGCIDVWDLAERFGVTETFMRKAICMYQQYADK